jgi:hypothetical protein
MDETLAVSIVCRENGGGGAVDPESALAASAIAAGFRFSSEKPYYDFVEKLGDGTVRRVTTWTFAAEEVDLDGERLSFDSFRRRFEDVEWVSDHRSSIIARLHVATMGLHHLHGTLFRKGPHVVIRNGQRFVSIPADASEEEQREWLGMLHG